MIPDEQTPHRYAVRLYTSRSTYRESTWDLYREAVTYADLMRSDGRDPVHRDKRLRRIVVYDNTNKIERLDITIPAIKRG